MTLFHRAHPRTITARKLARGLGWLSIILGLFEILARRSIRHQVGAPANGAMLAAHGLRELGTGVAILASRNPVKRIWGRVAGDVVGLATLAPALKRENPQRAAASAALLFLLATTALDIYVAAQGDEE